MKKRKLLSILMPLFALGVMTGCNGDNSGTKDPEYSNDKTYHWIEGKEAEKARHDYEDVPDKTVASTCKDKGQTVQKCKVCNYEKVTETKLLDHELVEDTTAATAATCNAEGSKVMKCKNCEFKKTEKVAKTAHNFGTGTAKEVDGVQGLEFECSICHEKSTNLVKFNTITEGGTAATDGKFASDGSYGTWNVSLPAGEYQVYMTAKFSSSGANYKFSGENSRGISVKYNDVEVEFDGTKTAEDYNLTTTGFNEFTFFNITATGGQDTLAFCNPYYRLVFDVNSYLRFVPVVK